MCLIYTSKRALIREIYFAISNFTINVFIKRCMYGLYTCSIDGYINETEYTDFSHFYKTKQPVIFLWQSGCRKFALKVFI
jgi:hypothetical protein